MGDDRATPPMIRKLNKAPRTRPKHALFCRIRNEDYFLPHFLAHYRALGIDHFYFADDRSTDGTREKLLAQPDCTVVEAEYSLADEVDGVPGKILVSRQVPEEIIGPGWTLTADADEFLVLPPPFETIAELTADLEAKGQISCIAAMTDFYPRTLAHRFADRALSPFKAFPMFDAGPYFVWREGENVPFLFYCGVRHRLNEWMYEINRGKVWQFYRPTLLQKIPLIKWGNGMVPEKNSHVTNIPPYTKTQVVLAHFKFYPDLDIKIQEALETNFYHGNSYYYRLLQLYLPQLEHRSLVALVSRKYSGPESLENAKLLFADGPTF